MSESASESKPKTPRSPNRWGAGTLAVLQTVLLVCALVSINYLSANHYKRADLSRDADYTLSSATRRYITSEAVTSRPKPVKWVMAFRRTSPFYERVRVLAEEYERLSNHKITLEVVDPMRSADRTQEITATYGLPLTKDLIVMDARSNDEPVSTEDAKGEHILHPNVKVIVSDDFAVYSTAEGQRRITGFQGEDVLTARLVEAVEGRSRKMYFLSDKTGFDAIEANSPLQGLRDLLRLQNVELKGIGLAGLKEIPADAEAVALLAPAYDPTDEELAVLEAYWNRPKSALLVMLNPSEVPPKLRTFLRARGVTPRRDRIVAKRADGIDTTARGVFTYGFDFIKDLAGQTAIFEGASSSLEVRENAEDLMNKQINPFPLVQVADGFWGETKFGAKNIAFDEKEDNKGPLYLAAGVERGAANNDRFAGATSRMVIISTIDFLNPKQQHAENIDFLASSVNWLVDRGSLAGIGPHSLHTYKLPILDAQVSFINRVNLFFLPAFLLVAGLFVWSSRRA